MPAAGPAAAAGGVFALDLARVVGWAHSNGGVPTWGAWHLPLLGGEGARYAALENELADALEDLAPHVVLIEAPLPLAAVVKRTGGWMSTENTMRQMHGLRAVAHCEAWRHSTAVEEIDAPTVRREVMGNAWFSKDVVKREVVLFCRSRGWRVTDPNAADALMLLEWRRLRSGGKPALVLAG